MSEKDCKCIKVYEDKLMSVVGNWTKEAQNSCNNDTERHVYYKCAEELFNFINEDK